MIMNARIGIKSLVEHSGSWLIGEINGYLHYKHPNSLSYKDIKWNVLISFTYYKN